MEHLNPKVLVIFFVKNFLGTIYIIPIWFLSVTVFEAIWTNSIELLPEDIVIFLLYGAGVIFFFLLILGCYYWAWLTFHNFTYELQNDGLHIHRGVIIRKHIVIPYSAIETVVLYVNPFVARFLDLYNVHIKTREQTNTEGTFRKKHTELIPGLTPETAKHLRTEIIKYSHVQPVRKTFFDPVSGKYH